MTISKWNTEVIIVIMRQKPNFGGFHFFCLLLLIVVAHWIVRFCVKNQNVFVQLCAHFGEHVQPNCFHYNYGRIILKTKYYANQHVSMCCTFPSTIFTRSLSHFFFYINLNHSISEKNEVKRNQIWPWYSVIPMLRCKFIRPNVRWYYLFMARLN